MPSPDGLILVTGGHGFIGGNVVRRLVTEGHKVRIADISCIPYLDIPAGVEAMIGNLCDPVFCVQAVHEVKAVLHFAATMGGMGVIHSDNDFTIYQENHRMTLNLLHAAVSTGVDLFFYASSACVYPDSLQNTRNSDVSLKEEDVWAELPPRPQGLYGLEKFNSECVVLQYASRMRVRIARFHNIFGPGGCWAGGREKAPAALLRKALALKRSITSSRNIEIWGDGTQRRSFCYIDDAVEAVLTLVRSDCREVVNIGSDRSVTIQDLADIAVHCAGLDPTHVAYQYVGDKPVGVGSRNSNNDRVRSLLNWSPRTTLEEGMRRTTGWIAGQMEKELADLDGDERERILGRYLTSEKVDLQADAATFAILLPITSRGTTSPVDCLQHLVRFARSLAATTVYDIGRMGARYRVHIYLAIDDDDDFLLAEGKPNKAEDILHREGFLHVDTIICNHPRGHVCSLWRDCARRAWEDRADYITLMGDDVTLQDPCWMSAVVDAFASLAVEQRVPHGFGCVAFTDTSFPGMPTFPVLHRTHMDIFGGEIIPDIFVNQDGDPFLFQLYRRWGCSRMIPSRISNAVGGSEAARYKKVSATGWTFRPLEDATLAIELWLRRHSSAVQRRLTIDVVIPCYRVNLTYIDKFLALRPSLACSVMFIIIVDDPNSPKIMALNHKYGHRPDVRIRVHEENLGASAARNRGLQESSAEWVIFLDDDVEPQEDILEETEKAIRNNPGAAGFVGTALFPVADTIAIAAIHLAGVTYFWDIARKRPDDTDLPWGVTANLIARRNVEDNVAFDLGFPKTGGGEDIDYCLRKRDYSVMHGGSGFHAAPDVVVTHPWWNNGRRSYWRFYMWGKGDGALIAKYPQYSYREVVPNSAELLVICVALTVGGCVVCLLSGTVGGLLLTALLGMRTCLSLLLANVLHDLYRHSWQHPERTAALNMTLSGWRFVVAMAESTFIRIFSEYGRLVGVLERGEYSALGMAFDWFTNRAGDGPGKEEDANRVQRVALWALILAITYTV